MAPTTLDRALDLLATTPYGRVGLSRNALPFVLVTRHVVSGHGLLVRVHRGLGLENACDGAVVAYEADNLGEGSGSVWSAHLVGVAHLARPGPDEIAALGPLADSVDGVPFDPAYLRIEPQYASMHHLDGVAVRTHAA